VRFITAKFNSQCHETGAKIKKGDPILYDPHLKKAYCKTSSKYQEQNTTDPAAGAIQANEEAYFDNFCQRNGI